MGVIIARSTRTTQPQSPIAPASGSLGAGIELLWTATSASYSSVGKPVSPVGGLALEATSKGVGAALDGSSKSINTNRKITYPSGTILLLTNLKTLGANKRIFTQTSNDAGASEGIVLADDGGFAINGSSISLLSLSVGLNNIVCTWGGSSSHAGYVNGVPQAPYGPSGGAPSSAAGDYNFEIGAFSYSGGRLFWSNQTPLLACIWSRILTSNEIALVSSNPWQLFTPLPRRIWVPSAGGAGGTVALTGSAVTASAGTLTPSASIPLSGQAATASAGTIAPASSVTVSGQAATASAGTLAPSVSIPLSGQAATASAGTVSPTVTIALTGTAVTASAGTVTYSAGNNISLTLTGTAVAASAGNLGLSSTVPVSGSAAAASAGTLTPGTSVAVSGTAVTASAGTVTYSANQDLTLALSGEAVQVSAGTITVVGGVSAVAVTSGAPGPRQQRWVVYINGKRYIGSLQEIEQIVAEFAEEQAEKAQTAKPPKKPKIKVEAGRVIGKTESAQPAQVAQQHEQVVVQQQVKDIYAEAYARAIAQMELDEEEDIISLL